MKNSSLPAGKLPASLLAELLPTLPTTDPALLLGPAVGEDAAVIDFVPGQDELLVAKSDPITFATDEIGFYAVNVCANDLGVSGATPRFYLPTLLLPAGHSDEALIRRIFTQIGDICRALRNRHSRWAQRNYTHCDTAGHCRHAVGDSAASVNGEHARRTAG